MELDYFTRDGKGNDFVKKKLQLRNFRLNL